MAFQNFLYSIWYIYFNDIVGVEYVETSQSGMRDIGKIITKYFPGKSIFYDLGSGRGSLLFPLSRIHPKCNFFGIENISFQVLFCHFLQYIGFGNKNLHFLQDDFSTANLSRANILFLYVPRFLLPGLQKMLQANMHKKQILVLYRISFTDWTPIEIIPTDFVKGISQNNIYIYKNI